MSVRILVGDCRDVLRTLPDQSVHCVVTSPPYWGLRDYGLPPAVWGGDPGCEHAWADAPRGGRHQRGPGSAATSTLTNPQRQDALPPPQDTGAFCERCDAWRGQLGLEPTPALYIEHMVDVFDEVWRVLRADGTLWLNLGDSYMADGGAGNRGTRGERFNRRHTQSNLGVRTTSRQRAARFDSSADYLKPKDLVGMPWRVALALQASGWWLRQEIIWHKRAPMPESIGDRPTRAHEQVFLLARSERYFYDATAIMEPAVTRRSGNVGRYDDAPDRRQRGTHLGSGVPWANDGGGRNRRSVWTLNPEPYDGAHFAVMPTKLVEPCILAGTSERGCCSSCGAPWLRVVEKAREFLSGSGRSGVDPEGKNGEGLQGGGETRDVRRGPVVFGETVGWRAGCDCIAGPPVPCVVLDPFGGSGTVGAVAEHLGRHSILAELNPDYVRLAERRTAQPNLFAQGAPVP